MTDSTVADRKRLLVVADDVASAEALRAHLARHGFAVARATSARAAARAARELAPEVVLIDAAIHGGWRDVVLALDGLVERRRVAVLAAYWSADARAAAREFGIGETLLKQLEGPALLRRLEDLAGASSVAGDGLGRHGTAPAELPDPVSPGAPGETPGRGSGRVGESDRGRSPDRDGSSDRGGRSDRERSAEPDGRADGRAEHVPTSGRPVRHRRASVRGRAAASRGRAVPRCDGPSPYPGPIQRTEAGGERSA
ncbi:MAG TPA: hypothetical protein VNO86_03945 [Candidatus Binatia bacterium]|nr:hypothetical protein [Candidatus Binatia bacterium]